MHAPSGGPAVLECEPWRGRMPMGDDVINLCGCLLKTFRREVCQPTVKRLKPHQVGTNCLGPSNSLTIDNAKATCGALDRKRNCVLPAFRFSQELITQPLWCLASLKFVDLPNIHNSSRATETYPFCVETSRRNRVTISWRYDCGGSHHSHITDPQFGITSVLNEPPLGMGRNT